MRRLAAPAVLLLVVSLAALAPAAARAASVAVDGDLLSVTAAPGEENALTVEPAAQPGALLVTDAAGPLTVERGCTPLDWGVVCPAARMQAELGDGDDTADLAAVRLAGSTLNGGEGDDTLIGSAGPDTLDGGPGADLAYAGQGRDSVTLNDGEADRAWCGGGADAARAEVLDQLELDCEHVDLGRAGTIGRLVRVKGGGRFVPVPGQPWARVDARIVDDVLFLVRRYHVRLGDGFALFGHALFGEHPLGLAVDLYPGPGGSWGEVARLARWAEPRQNHPRAPFRWVGWNGDRNHGDPAHCRPAAGCPPHLHLSWAHSPGGPGRPVATVWTFRVAGGEPTRGVGSPRRAVSAPVAARAAAPRSAAEPGR